MVATSKDRLCNTNMLYREQFCEFEVKLSLAWFTNDKLFPLYRLQERVLDTS